MRNFTPDEATEFARAQRQELSRAEHLLWQCLRGGRLDGVKFKRQVPFGACIADFSCASVRLIVEGDDPAHARNSVKDTRQDAWFESAGVAVLRFSDEEVLMATDRVTHRIAEAVSARKAPSPDPLRRPSSPCSGEGR